MHAQALVLAVQASQELLLLRLLLHQMLLVLAWQVPVCSACLHAAGPVLQQGCVELLLQEQAQWAVAAAAAAVCPIP